MTKGKDTRFFYKIPVTASAVEITCLTALEGFGITANAVEIEPCLGDEVIVEEVGDAKYAPVTLEYKHTPAASGVPVTLRDAVEDKTLGRVSIGYNTATPIFATFDAYVSEHVELPIERNQDMKSRVVLLRQSAESWSTTTPT